MNFLTNHINVGKTLKIVRPTGKKLRLSLNQKKARKTTAPCLPVDFEGHNEEKVPIWLCSWVVKASLDISICCKQHF